MSFGTLRSSDEATVSPLGDRPGRYKMQKEDDERLKEQHGEGDQTELSNVWLELLGLRPGENRVSIAPDQQAIPVVEGDPWRKLLQAENIELVDLQQVHLPISEREVEQLLQLMREQATENPGDGKDPEN